MYGAVARNVNISANGMLDEQCLVGAVSNYILSSSHEEIDISYTRSVASKRFVGPNPPTFPRASDASHGSGDGTFWLPCSLAG